MVLVWQLGETADKRETTVQDGVSAFVQSRWLLLTRRRDNIHLCYSSTVLFLTKCFVFFVPKPDRKKRTLPTFILALEFPQNDGTWVHPVFATDWFTSAQINCTKENAPNVAGVRSPEGPLESAGAPLNLFFWLCGGICHLVCSSLLGQQTERD